MAISRKGRRRIMVGGRVFYWDFRVAGKKPGRGPMWDWPTDPRQPVVRVVSEDKRWRLTFEGYAAGSGGRVLVDPGGKEFRFLDRPGERRSHPVTPGTVRQLIEKYFDPSSSDG